MARNYSRKSPPILADLAFIWDSANSDWRLTTLSDVSTLLEANMTLGRPEANSEYAAPLTGVTHTITDADDDVHLILTPAGTIATLTIALPAVATARDKQQVIVNSTQIVTTLTITSALGTITGSPATWLGTANNYFTLTFDTVLSTWYRTG